MAPAAEAKKGWKNVTSKDVLAELMRECNISHWKQKQINDAIKASAPLPENLKPLCSLRTSKAAAWRPSQKEKELRAKGPPKSFAGRKMRENILRDNPPVREQFRGAAPGKNLEAEKERLSLIMQFKGMSPEEVADGIKAERFSRAGSIKKLQETARGEAAESAIESVDRLLREVEERHEFLQRMRELGLGADYEAKMLSEIRVRMQQIDAIERRPLVGDTLVSHRGRKNKDSQVQHEKQPR